MASQTANCNTGPVTFDIWRSLFMFLVEANRYLLLLFLLCGYLYCFSTFFIQTEFFSSSSLGFCLLRFKMCFETYVTYSDEKNKPPSVFNRTMLCRARYCHGQSSLSVCPSVFDVEVLQSYSLGYFENNYMHIYRPGFFLSAAYVPLYT